MAIGSIFSILFGGYVLLMVASLLQHTYTNFIAPQCEPPWWMQWFQKGRPKACRDGRHSLFASDERVDMKVFVTSNSTLAWWTPDGLSNLTELEPGNRSETLVGPFSESREASFILPVDIMDEAQRRYAKELSDVHLFLHFFLLRESANLAEEISKGAILLESVRERSKGAMHPSYPNGSHMVTPDLLHVEAPFTTIRPAREKRKELATVDAATSEDLRPWLLSGLAGTSFVTPSAAVATVRHMMLGGGLAWWLQNKQPKDASKELVQEEAPRRHSLQYRGHVDITASADFNQYDPRYRYPPLLFNKIDFDPKQGGMRQRPIFYMTTKRNKTEHFVPGMFVGDAEYWREHRIGNASDVPQDGNATNASNATRPSFRLEFRPTHIFQYCMQQALKEYMTIYEKMGIPTEIFTHMFRRPLYILAVEQAIGIVKVWLTGLAFKNDISFFRGRDNYRGLSSRSLLTDLFQEILLFLYFCDMDETSNVLVFQFGVSALVSAYKYVKVSKLKVFFRFLLPWLESGRRTDDDELERQTDEFDAEGMRYATYVMYPLAVVSGIYCLYYYQYKSLWSWTLSSLMTLMYSSRFIHMLPQVFINHKLQSVAHMPWRVLTLKFFNTFIDDFYAWIVVREYVSFKYRLMTLQDDVIFFVLMWQRYKYKVDYTRADEFGYVYTLDGQDAGDVTETAAVKDEAKTGKIHNTKTGKIQDGDGQSSGKKDEHETAPADQTSEKDE